MDVKTSINNKMPDRIQNNKIIKANFLNNNTVNQFSISIQYSYL